MKKLSFILFVSFLTILGVSNVYSQATLVSDEIVFVFENKTVVENGFVDKANNKVIEFKIRGVKSKAELTQLSNQISNYRGVLSFIVGEKLENNDIPASMELYKFADHWMYYKFLFIKNGINKVIFDNEVTLSENLAE